MASTVDITSFPTARDDATEDKWTKYARGLLSDGVLANVANNLEVFADSTGMLVKVKTGRCYIDGFAGDLTSQQSLDIAAAHPTNPRIDRVVARLTTTSPATISVRVVTGTAASSPSPPALLDDATHTDIPLATVAVAALAGTIAAGNVTDGRAYTGPHTFSNISQAVVNTSESTASVVAVSLTTFGPSVKCYVPPSGRVKVTIAAEITTSAGEYGIVYWAASGANTILATNSQTININFGAGNSGQSAMSNSFLVDGLNPGETTFLLQYAGTNGASASFAFRRIIVETFP